jgi:hypothetical protein
MSPRQINTAECLTCSEAQPAGKSATFGHCTACEQETCPRCSSFPGLGLHDECAILEARDKARRVDCDVTSESAC